MEQQEDAVPGLRERKRLALRERVAEIAWALFEQHGLAAVTMEQIAAQAEISRVTLYKHFPVKEAILSQAMHQKLWSAWPEIQAELALHAAGMPRLRCFLEHHAAWCDAHREYVFAYLLYRLSDRRLPEEGRERSGFEQIFTGLVAQGQAVGAFRCDKEAAVLAHYLQFAHLGAMLRGLSVGGSLVAEISQMLEVMASGLQQDGGR